MSKCNLASNMSKSYKFGIDRLPLAYSFHKKGTKHTVEQRCNYSTSLFCPFRKESKRVRSSRNEVSLFLRIRHDILRIEFLHCPILVNKTWFPRKSIFHLKPKEYQNIIQSVCYISHLLIFILYLTHCVLNYSFYPDRIHIELEHAVSHDKPLLFQMAKMNSFGISGDNCECGKRDGFVISVMDQLSWAHATTI